MKKRNIIIGLVVTMALGIGVTAYAATEEGGASTTKEKLGLKRITSMSGKEYVSEVLKSKLGLTDEEITTALDSGKTLHDLAIEKGLSEDDLKVALLEEKTKAIDTAVSEGKITEEEGVTLKEKLNKNMENCSGNFGKGEGGSGSGSGKMMKNGQGKSFK